MAPGVTAWTDKVRMVLDKIRTDGLAATLEAVKNKLDQPLTLGYCNVGVVAGLGTGVEGFAVGDRVVSNGRHAAIRAGFAHVRFGLEYAKELC